jgi:hypothetical protein
LASRNMLVNHSLVSCSGKTGKVDIGIPREFVT